MPCVRKKVKLEKQDNEEKSKASVICEYAEFLKNIPKKMHIEGIAKKIKKGDKDGK